MAMCSTDVIRSIILKGEGVPKSIARIAEWAKSQKELKAFDIWDEIQHLDLSADQARLREWLEKGLTKLAKSPKSRLLIISLGGGPEVFQMLAWGCVGGDEGSEKLIAALRKKKAVFCGGVEELVDWDVMKELFDEYLRKLPSELWQRLYKGEPDWEAASVVGEAVAAVLTMEALRSLKLDWAALLGKRKEFPVVFGYNEGQRYYGDLTHSGWQMAKK